MHGCAPKDDWETVCHNSMQNAQGSSFLLVSLFLEGVERLLMHDEAESG